MHLYWVCGRSNLNNSFVVSFLPYVISPLVEAKCFCCCFASIMKSYCFWINPVLDCGISSFVLCCNAILCHDFVMIYSSQPFLF